MVVEAQTKTMETAVKTASAKAAHCLWAPEGACPAYASIQKLSASQDTQATLSGTLDRLRGCPGCDLGECRPLAILEQKFS